MWVCNHCRRKPPNQRRINERFIEPVQTSHPGSSASGRLSSQSNTSTSTNQRSDNTGRSSLIRQQSERESRVGNDKSNFRISPRTEATQGPSPMKSSNPKQIPHHSLPRTGLNHSKTAKSSEYNFTGKAKRSPPLAELDSGVASLSIEDPNLGPSGPTDSVSQREKNVIVEVDNESISTATTVMPQQQRSSTLPERSKTRPKRRYLPRHPSLTDTDALHGTNRLDSGKPAGKNFYLHRSQPDLRPSPPRPGGGVPFDSSSDEWHRRSFETDCQSEESSCSGYWDLDRAAVMLKLWWENLAESSAGEGRLVSAIERVSAVSYNMGPPSIRLCLVHPGRGRAARRRTAAAAQDAIETKDGGWCWTTQTAIGWGPLPKRALSRLVTNSPSPV